MGHLLLAKNKAGEGVTAHLCGTAGGTGNIGTKRSNSSTGRLPDLTYEPKKFSQPRAEQQRPEPVESEVWRGLINGFAAVRAAQDSGGCWAGWRL